MDQWRNFAPGASAPATWPDGIESLLGNYSSPGLLMKRFGSAQVTLTAGGSSQAATLAVQGSPRWITATATATHPGGSAGIYKIYACCTADSFGSAAGPPIQETDTTTRSFTLKITSGTPSGTGGEALSRQIGVCHWDGSAITGVYNWLNPADVPSVLALPATGMNPDQIVDYLVSASAAGSVGGSGLYVWRMRWDPGTTQWLWVGGSPMVASVTPESVTSSNVAGDLVTPTSSGPALVAPYAGDYAIGWGATIRPDAAVSGNPNGGVMTLQIGGSAVASSDVTVSDNASVAGLIQIAAKREQQFAVAAPASIVTTKYKASVNGRTAGFAYRELWLRPVRVTP